MTKTYNILLDNKKIGTTEFEKADVPMGVVFGKVNFINTDSGYSFFKTYCQNNNINITTDYSDEKLLITADIPALKVLNESGIEIKGQGINIEGMETDFEIIVAGIPYPFYEIEFPFHTKSYNEMFEK